MTYIYIKTLHAKFGQYLLKTVASFGEQRGGQIHKFAVIYSRYVILQILLCIEIKLNEMNYKLIIITDFLNCQHADRYAIII